MANKRSSPTTEAGASPLNPRGPSVADMDRIGRDSDLIRGTQASSSSTSQEQGSPANTGWTSGSGDSSPETIPDEGIGELAAPLALPATLQQPHGEGNPFQSADGVLKTIADRFNAAREVGKGGAWRQFQRDLMNASPYLVPVLLPYKDLISIVSDIEKEIKGSASQAGQSNEELLAKFLSGDSKIGGDLIPPVPEGIDTLVKES